MLKTVTPDGSGPGALALLSTQLLPRFHGQHPMTAKPSAMQLRRCFIPYTSHSQMIHSSNFEMMPRKAGAFCCSYRTQRLQHTMVAERAAILIFSPPWPAIPRWWALLASWPSRTERGLLPCCGSLFMVPLWVGFCACAWDVMSYGLATPMTPRATRPRATPPLTTSLPRFIMCSTKTSHTAGRAT